jgi:hypothetical protein
LISIIANFFTVVVELTVMTSLVIMSLASIGHTSKFVAASLLVDYLNYDSSSAIIAENSATARTFAIEDAELSRKSAQTKGL